VLSSDLPGVNPETLIGMILYYRLMTKWSGLGNSTELSRMGLSQSLVVGGDAVSGPLKLTSVHGSLFGARDVTLLIDLVP
jgi:hypothetical protein